MTEKELDERFDLAKKSMDYPATLIFLLTTYVELRPGHGEAWALLGDALREINRWQEAEHAMLRALELAENSTNQGWVKVRLASMYRDQGRLSDAKSKYIAASARPYFKNQGWFWVLGGSVLSKLAEFSEAERWFRHAIICDEVDLDEAYGNLGLVLRARGKYQEAEEAFGLAEKASPERSEYREAIRDLNRLKKIRQRFKGVH